MCISDGIILIKYVTCMHTVARIHCLAAHLAPVAGMLKCKASYGSQLCHTDSFLPVIFNESLTYSFFPSINTQKKKTTGTVQTGLCCAKTQMCVGCEQKMLTYHTEAFA